jgi:hypothetical protein
MLLKLAEKEKEEQVEKWNSILFFVSHAAGQEAAKFIFMYDARIQTQF